MQLQLSRSIAAWAAQLDWQALPNSVQQRSINSFKDTISVMVAGTQTRSANIAARVARADHGNHFLAAGGSSSLAMAAFANGVAASALDYDDGHYKGGAIHGSAPTIAAAFTAIDESTTVAEFCTAHVAGLEVALRAGSLLWMKHQDNWYHSAGCVGASGGAFGAGLLRGLTDDQMHAALVIAFQHAPMATVAFPMVKESIGWGASSGAVAAFLAESGWVGFAGEPSDYQPHVTPNNIFDRENAVASDFVMSYGDVYESENNYLKTFSSCRYTHSPAAGLIQLMAEENFAAQDVQRLIVGTFEGGAMLNDRNPASLEHLQYSYPHVLAAAALYGRVGPRQLSEENLHDPDRNALVDRIEVVHDPSLDHLYPEHGYPSRVTAQLQDGRVISRDFFRAPDDDVKLTADELHEKWIDALTITVSPENASEFLARASEPSERVRDLLALITPSNTGG